MKKRTIKRVSELKVGDLISWYDDTCAIREISPIQYGDRIKVVIELSQNMKMRNARSFYYVSEQVFYGDSTVVVPYIKPCAPCYDSDCDCIYDGVVE